MSFFKKIIKRKYPYVIAEIGINHNGDMNLAKEMIIAAKKSGADCVKFQSFIADKYIAPYSVKASYQKNSKDFQNSSQKDIIKSCEISIKELVDLTQFSKKNKIDILSTPFENLSLKSLIKLKMKAIKISSCNLTNYPFLNIAAKSRIPILLSTGMGNISEVIKAVEIFKNYNSELILLQCTSNYPSKIKNANLNVIKTYQNLFDVPVGFSDHTKNNTSAIVSTILGAKVIEKHFTLSRSLIGIDQKASIEPLELKNLVENIKEAIDSLGKNMKFKTEEEEDTSIALRRSIVASRPLKKNKLIKLSDLTLMRPGNGLNSSYVNSIVGKKLFNNKKKYEQFNLSDIK